MHPEGVTERVIASVPTLLVVALADWASARRMSRSEALTEAIRRITREESEA